MPTVAEPTDGKQSRRRSLLLPVPIGLVVPVTAHLRPCRHLMVLVSVARDI
jgi:hypothetical protein